MGHINELCDFTVSAFLFHPTEKKLCLHYHRKYNKWLQFGGHIELDEQPEDALVREIKEESGLDPDQYEVLQADHPKTGKQKSILLPFNINVHKVVGKHSHIDLEYLVQSKTEEIKPGEGESQKFAWLTIEIIREMYKREEVSVDMLTICEWIFENHM